MMRRVPVGFYFLPTLSSRGDGWANSATPCRGGWNRKEHRQSVENIEEVLRERFVCVLLMLGLYSALHHTAISAASVLSAWCDPLIALIFLRCCSDVGPVLLDEYAEYVRGLHAASVSDTPMST